MSETATKDKKLRQLKALAALARSADGQELLALIDERIAAEVGAWDKAAEGQHLSWAQGRHQALTSLRRSIAEAHESLRRIET